MTLVLPVLVLLMFPSCTGGGGISIDDMKKRAEEAGEIAALSYLAIEKPNKEKAEQIKAVIDLFKKTVKDWQEGGFKATLPELNKAIDELVPVEKDKPLNLLCKKLASTLVDELDALFNRHPEWKKKGAEVAGIVESFAAGASKGFAKYLAES
jgi:hypothetical protein